MCKAKEIIWKVTKELGLREPAIVTSMKEELKTRQTRRRVAKSSFILLIILRERDGDQKLVKDIYGCEWREQVKASIYRKQQG